MGMLPKSNKNLPITARKKAVPGVKPAEPPVSSIENKPLPKEVIAPKEEPKKVPPQKTVPPRRPMPPRPASKVAAVPAPLPKYEGTDVLAIINRRQRQLILHSVLYYRMNTNLITDKTWDTWARELLQLQTDYPEVTKKSDFYEDMKDFDATTGFHLADNQWGINKAQWLLDVLKKKGEDTYA